MRDLLVAIDPNTWTQVSALIFTICFFGLLLWVYAPQSKDRYQKAANIPFDSD